MHYFPVNLFLASLQSCEYQCVLRSGPTAASSQHPCGTQQCSCSWEDAWARTTWWKSEGVLPMEEGGSSVTGPKYVFTTQSTDSAALNKEKSSTWPLRICTQLHLLQLVSWDIFSGRNTQGLKPGSKESQSLSPTLAHSVSSLLSIRPSDLVPQLIWPSPSGSNEP